MPELITTQTRNADLGKPRIIIIGGGFGGAKVALALKGLKAEFVRFDFHNHHTFQPVWYRVPATGQETSSIVHLISLTGFKNKLFTLLIWMWNYFSHDKCGQLMISQPKDDI